jgi:hypothetical protein
MTGLLLPLAIGILCGLGLVIAIKRSARHGPETLRRRWSWFYFALTAFFALMLVVGAIQIILAFPGHP